MICKYCFSTNNLGCQFCTVKPYKSSINIEEMWKLNINNEHKILSKRLWNKQRIQDLAKSIQLYSELELSTKNIELMKTWTNEMNELLKEMK